MGEPQVVTDGRILPEASPPEAVSAIPLRDARDFVLAALLLGVAAWNTAARRLPPQSVERRVGRRLLVAVALASLVAWPNFLNFHYSGFVHTWKFFHYFMGAKCLPEVGYTCLRGGAGDPPPRSGKGPADRGSPRVSRRC